MWTSIKTKGKGLEKVLVDEEQEWSNKKITTDFVTFLNLKKNWKKLLPIIQFKTDALTPATASHNRRIAYLTYREISLWASDSVVWFPTPPDKACWVMLGQSQFSRSLGPTYLKKYVLWGEEGIGDYKGFETPEGREQWDIKTNSSIFERHFQLKENKTHLQQLFQDLRSSYHLVHQSPVPILVSGCRRKK